MAVADSVLGMGSTRPGWGSKFAATRCHDYLESEMPWSDDVRKSVEN